MTWGNKTEKPTAKYCATEDQSSLKASSFLVGCIEQVGNAESITTYCFFANVAVQ